MSRIWEPQELLRVLGVEEPEEIHIWAIAEVCKAKVTLEPLEGCDANLVGFDNRAIITVNKHTHKNRQRFSIAHELGHWQRHRGQAYFSCQTEDFARLGPEREANMFAADLLMPQAMCRRLIDQAYPTFRQATELARRFQVSLTAMALRLTQMHPEPAALFLAKERHQVWCRPNDLVPTSLRFAKTLSPELLHCQDYCRRIPAAKSQWLSGYKKYLAGDFELWQESFQQGSFRLTILTFSAH